MNDKNDKHKGNVSTRLKDESNGQRSTARCSEDVIDSTRLAQRRRRHGGLRNFHH